LIPNKAHTIPFANTFFSGTEGEKVIWILVDVLQCSSQQSATVDRNAQQKSKHSSWPRFVSWKIEPADLISDTRFPKSFRMDQFFSAGA